MFFIPTLRNLLNSNTSTSTSTGHEKAADGHRRPRPQNGSPNIHLLCLSNGDYRDASDGPIRTQETHGACALIGMQNNTNDKKLAADSAVTVLNDERMKDGPNEGWSSDLISDTVMDHIRTRMAPSCFIDDSISSSKQTHDYLLTDPVGGQKRKPWAFMDRKSITRSLSTSEKRSMQSINLNILTFDKGGVSGHPNHLDTFKGIHYLLNEKCYIARDKQLESVAKLRLRREANAARKEKAGNIVVELNVSAYTLRTISNPLAKYFFWAFADIIPYLFIWAFQMLWYLVVYFLIGGLLWRKGLPQIQPFSRMKASPNGKNVQCRIMEPILVWRAMAAHHSQFVWYRRLSVMFSRYTFINDLQKLAIDTPPCDDDDDDDIASLPPVALIAEEDSTTKFLLSTLQINALREAVLPPGLHHRPWKRIYSLSRDGDSFVGFQKIMENWNQKPGGASTILLVKTAAGELIGGFADIPIVPLASTPVGSAAGSCLFALPSQKDGEGDTVEVWGKHFSSAKKIVLNASRRILAFGGGDSDGGVDEGFGLCLEDGFTRGTTARCSSFRNEPLVSDQEGVFKVLDVEVWGFVFGQF